MDKVILDASLKSKLNGTNAQIEFVDERGDTVGFFMPIGDLQRLRQLAAEEQRRLDRWGLSQLTEAQIDDSMREQKMYTTEEVIRHLESL